jgi:mannose-6-phosphate isomerase-like protein (cupin superfamily)
VVVPQTDGLLLLETPEGLREAPLVAGRSYYRDAGVEHNVINGSDHEVVFIEIEAR